MQQRAALLDYGRPGSRGGRRLTDVLRASYDLLNPDQQKVLRMLSAFAEPASLPDVAAVLNMSMKEVTGPVRVLVSGDDRRAAIFVTSREGASRCPAATAFTGTRPVCGMNGSLGEPAGEGPRCSPGPPAPRRGCC